MKNLLIMLVTVTMAVGVNQNSQAQVNVSVNIGSQPIWGPTGYDYVNYYYLPDLDIYYYVPLQQWIYYNGGRWITTTVLPPQYNNYDLYRMHKVIINDKQPYLRNAVYRNQYASFKGRYDQQLIRDSRDSKYYVINNHPMHAQAGNQGGPHQEGARPGGNPGQQPGRANGQQPGRNNQQQAGRNGSQQGGGRANKPQGEGRGPR